MDARAMLGDQWRATEANWRPGECQIAFHVTFEEDERLHAAARRVTAGLDPDALVPVEPRYLHLTLHGLGLESDVDGEEARAVAAEAAARCARVLPFVVELGPPRLLQTAVVLPAADARPVEELRRALHEAELAVCRVAAADGGGGDPHVSLAYARLPTPAGATLDALARHADVVVPVEVARLTLLRLRRDYRWEPLVRVPLGA